MSHMNVNDPPGIRQRGEDRFAGRVIERGVLRKSFRRRCSFELGGVTDATLGSSSNRVTSDVAGVLVIVSAAYTGTPDALTFPSIVSVPSGSTRDSPNGSTRGSKIVSTSATGSCPGGVNDGTASNDGTPSGTGLGGKGLGSGLLFHNPAPSSVSSLVAGSLPAACPVCSRASSCTVSGKEGREVTALSGKR